MRYLNLEGGKFERSMISVKVIWGSISTNFCLYRKWII